MILVFETHPVQYRAPLYQDIQKRAPESFSVAYGCLNPGFDREFNRDIAWDNPLLEGYDYTHLDNRRDASLRRRQSLSGKGILSLLRSRNPRAVLLTSLRYHFDFAAWASATALGIPVWIRCETQDEAFPRGAFADAVREELYRFLYRPVRRAFYIGELNREHYLRHGLRPEQFTFTPYVVPNPIASLSLPERQHLRESLRNSWNVRPDTRVVAFFGKLIPKKNPDLLLEAFKRLTAGQPPKQWMLLFVGSGSGEPALRLSAKWLGPQVQFAGFVNQKRLPALYLAADILVLPSRRQGETWGLVVNEALQAGCAVAVSDAVGCHRQFRNLERFRVFPDEDVDACAQAIRELAPFPRDMRWAESVMASYSIPAVAQTLADAFTEC